MCLLSWSSFRRRKADNWSSKPTIPQEVSQSPPPPSSAAQRPVDQAVSLEPIVSLGSVVLPQTEPTAEPTTPSETSQNVPEGLPSSETSASLPRSTSLTTRSERTRSMMTGIDTTTGPDSETEEDGQGRPSYKLVGSTTISFGHPDNIIGIVKKDSLDEDSNRDSAALLQEAEQWHTKAHQSQSMRALWNATSYYSRVLQVVDASSRTDDFGATVFDGFTCACSDWRQWSVYAQQFKDGVPTGPEAVDFSQLSALDGDIMRHIFHGFVKGLSDFQGTLEHYQETITMGRHLYLVAFDAYQDIIGSLPIFVDIQRANLTNAIHDLANAFITCYDRSGNVADIDEGVRLRREALALCPADDVDNRLNGLNGIAGALIFRFREFHESEDIEETIRLGKESIAVSAGHNNPLGHHYLSTALFYRAVQMQSKEDIAESISQSQLALEQCDSTSSSAHRQILNHLSLALIQRGILNQSADDIREAINCKRLALASIGNDHPEWGTLTLNLSINYERLFSLSRKPEDADESLQLALDALQFFPEGRSGRSGCLRVLAELYATPNTGFYDMHASLCRLKESISDNYGSASKRLNDALAYFRRYNISEDTTMKMKELELEIRQIAVHLLPQVANFSLEAGPRLSIIREADRLAVITASQALTLGKPLLALEIAEEGRAIFWTQTLRLRTQLDNIPDDLRLPLLEVAKALESSSLEHADSDVEAARRRRMAEKYDSLVDQVRALPGFDRFLLPPTSTSLIRAAQRGPVVLLIGPGTVCKAIIITKDGHIRPISLRTTEEKLKKLCVGWEQSSARSRQFEKQRRDMGEEEVAHTNSVGLGGSSVEDVTVQLRDDVRISKPVSLWKGDQEESLAILQIIWDDIVSVVIQVLQLKVASGRDRPRLWWCPADQFTFLPLHAAGHHGSNEVGKRISDYVVSSYTPTLQALVNARDNMKPLRTEDAKILLAAAPYPSHGSALPSTVKEIQAIASIVPTVSVLPLPPSDDVVVDAKVGITVKTTMDQLPHTTILHLACHGRQGTDHPLESGFVLRDDMLSIMHLLRQPLPHAFLAFLSACETAKGSSEQPDQSVHLAATMLFSGFKSIFATMWSMDDIDGPFVASEVYKQLFQTKELFLDPDIVPYAIDSAVTKLREKHYSPSRWATYIHIGV